ncbi:MAG: isocitrate/isopropylmalate family dehydrogenase, partial [Acidobacteria bacterium]|nr:isocitrate/isopropylmalate family dehydrogenase [Acidobacteriota bacterium]
ANPLGAIASAALLLRYSCRLEREARALENAISKALADGYGTPDLKSQPNRVSTNELGDIVRQNLAEN